MKLISPIRLYPVLTTMIVCAAAVAAIAGTILFGLNERHSYWHEQYYLNMRPAVQLSELRFASRQIRSTFWREVALHKSGSETETLKDIDANIARMESAWSAYYPEGISSSEEQQVARDISTALPRRLQIAERGRAYLASGDYAALSTWQSANASFVDHFDGLISNDIDINLAQANQNDIRIAGIFNTMQWSLTALLAMCAASAFTLLFWVARGRTSLLGKVRYHTLLANRLFDITNNIVIFTDALGNIERVNPAFTKITGYAPEEVIGKNPRLLHSGQQSPEFYCRMWQCLRETGTWSGAIWNRKKNGEVYLEEQTIFGVSEFGKVISSYIKISRDATMEHEQRDNLRKLAMHDALTGLSNRLGLGELLSHGILQAKRSGSQIALLLVDLDGFKDINDRYGHAAGDIVLKTIADRLRKNLRECDMAARLGGDEFVVALENIGDSDHVDSIAQALVRAIGQPISLGDTEAQVTPSIGISLYPDHGEDAKQLLHCADSAMYIAKNAGKNNFRFYEPCCPMEV